jgi:hypothetical protein
MANMSAAAINRFDDFIHYHAPLRADTRTTV